MIEHHNTVAIPTITIGAFSKEQLSCQIAGAENDYFLTAIITVPASIVQAIFDNAVLCQTDMVGQMGSTILKEYTSIAYKQTLLEYTKNFLLQFCVLDFLHEQLLKRHIVDCQGPRLTSITMDIGSDAIFVFSINTIPVVSLLDWKYFVFKAPKRKNYKDIDRQVDLFIKEESDRLSSSLDGTVAIFDWVYFTAYTKNHHLVSEFWIHIADEEIGTPLRELFLGRKKGETFIASNSGLEEYIGNGIAIGYPLEITVQDILPNNYVCFNFFKSFFRIKTQKDLHKKLIEVFSYRNDISQRRLMVEEALQLLRSKHSLDVPQHLIIRQKKRILEIIQQNPDYNVYRRNSKFEVYLEQLSRKQVEEIALLDHIAYADNITITHDDLKGYLNLTKRNKTKEFLYFPFPETVKDGYHVPIIMGVLKQHCLREKTINHVIYHFLKK